jgi:hypothetical protein
MKRATRFSLSLAALAAVSAASAVQAQQLPLPLARRPLTLTRGTLRADAALSIAHLQASVLGLTAASTSVGLALGAGFGVTEDIEFGATVIPLTLAPAFDFQAPTFYGAYRFLTGDVEVGVQFALTLPINRDFALGAGVPVLFHLGQTARLDTGAFLGLTFGDSLGKALNFPIAFTANLGPHLFVGARTGVLLPNFDRFAMPLGVYVGCTLAAGGGASPLADLTAGFDFPRFVSTSGADPIDTGLWTASVNGRVFINP